MIGIYWGAFDPPTPAHLAIIRQALKHRSIKKVVVIMNNHSYKTYTYPLATRIQLMHSFLDLDSSEQVSLLYQDDRNPLNYSNLSQLINEPLCAIAGYDAYRHWLHYSTSEERALYQAIAVVPRGNEAPILSDPHAFLLPIDDAYRHISSTKVKEYTLKRRSQNDSTISL